MIRSDQSLFAVLVKGIAGHATLPGATMRRFD
jgi:hypothetical protein